MDELDALTSPPDCPLCGLVMDGETFWEDDLLTFRWTCDECDLEEIDG